MSSELQNMKHSVEDANTDTNDKPSIRATQTESTMTELEILPNELPKSWQKRTDEQGAPYYVDTETGSFYRVKSKQISNDKTHIERDDEQKMQNSDDDNKSIDKDINPNKEWQCETCTLFNDSNATFCDACNAPRSKQNGGAEKIQQSVACDDVNMDDLSSEQRSKLTTFMDFVDVEAKSSLLYLTESNWDIEVAMNRYLQQHIHRQISRHGSLVLQNEQDVHVDRGAKMRDSTEFKEVKYNIQEQKQSSTSISIRWKCPKCTLENDANAMICVLCSAPRALSIVSERYRHFEKILNDASGARREMFLLNPFTWDILFDAICLNMNPKEDKADILAKIRDVSNNVIQKGFDFTKFDFMTTPGSRLYLEGIGIQKSNHDIKLPIYAVAIAAIDYKIQLLEKTQILQCTWEQALDILQHQSLVATKHIHVLARLNAMDLHNNCQHYNEMLLKIVKIRSVKEERMKPLAFLRELGLEFDLNMEDSSCEILLQCLDTVYIQINDIEAEKQKRFTCIKAMADNPCGIITILIEAHAMFYHNIDELTQVFHKIKRLITNELLTHILVIYRPDVDEFEIESLADFLISLNNTELFITTLLIIIFSEMVVD
eukprot:101213_1